MTTELVAGENAADETVEDENGEGQICALDGCENPLPARPVDPQGRRKGGRPSSYCGKAHADAASRARRAAQTAAVVDPLIELSRASEGLDAATRPLVATLGELRELLGRAEKGALAQLRRVEEEAIEARTEADDALRRTEQSERARDKALVQAREDRQARAEAEKAAERTAAEAEQITRDAWSKVAEHERAAGAAEAARAAAENARNELVASMRAAQEQLDDLRAARQTLAAELEQTRAELRERSTELAVLDERLTASRAQLRTAERSVEYARHETQRAREDAATAAAEAARQRAEREDAMALVGEERTKRRVAESRNESLEAQIAAARAELAETQSRLERKLAEAEPHPGEDTIARINSPGDE